VGIARATIVGHEPLPRRDEIELRRYEKQLRKEAADRVGISVAVLERAVHDFRVLLREMAKKG
jgi:DNA-directed RNA polymerase specialized sigma24 family protein